MSSSPDRSTSPALTARGGATRQRLIEAARAELLETGGTLEVAKVATRAEASPGLLYRYFGAKDGLVAAVVHEFYDSYDTAVFAIAVSPELGWTERERLRLSREIDFLCEDPLAPIIVGRRLREPSAAQADAERLAAQIDMAARNVAHAQRSGEVDPAVDARLVSAAFLGAFRELMAEAMSRDVTPSRQDLLDTIWRLGASIIPSA
ncbi:TetR family transcriptional regulator [Rhodococcus sp. AG1013]|uniref:TetR/AcrR family transcriptional regulator n=1 Tax=Rhodococcus sp. AG1013 TaxID=2183996 RepID=UPI000E0A53A6|nr:TetR/AcrR family transcriptional regulator [Rhodococcus sp. AG1013]RDI16144.1 TetR family transcriptional regulator [Rhodococcus sp. AG1013]